MKEIVDKLYENLQIERAKSLLEASGYIVINPPKIDMNKVENILDSYSSLMEKLR